MALINCPECGKEISDKSKQCIHCGCPLNDIITDQSTLYNMIYLNTNAKHDEWYVTTILYRRFNIPKNQAHILITVPNSVVLSGINKENIEYLQNFFYSEGYNMDFIPSDSDYINPLNTEIAEWDKDWRERQKNAIKCPTCGSTNTQKISTTSKVIGAATFGLLSKTARSQFKCNHCGYKW